MEREAGNDNLMVENLTLFNIIAGLDKDYTGTIKWGKTITYSYLPQNFNSYFDNCDLSLVDWLGQFSKEKEQTYLRSWLGRMLFSGEEGLKKAKVISGGEKVRCMLAKMMLTSGNLLIFDEPTNHLDLESITALNKGLINYKGNLLLTSHDQELMQTVCNRIIKITDKKVYDKYITYDEFVDSQMI